MEMDEKELRLVLYKLYLAYRNAVDAEEYAPKPSKLEFVYYVVESLTPPRVPGRIREMVAEWAEGE